MPSLAWTIHEYLLRRPILSPAGLFSFGLLDGLPVRLRRPYLREAPAGFGLERLATAFMNNPARLLKPFAIRVQSDESRRPIDLIGTCEPHIHDHDPSFITMAPDWLRRTVFFALGLIAQASLLSAAQVEDGIVAIVNSDLIMLSEMKRELAPERERIQKEYRGDALARRLKTAEYMALTSMIERKLQLQEAKARGITVTDQEVQQAIRQMKQQGGTVDETNPADIKRAREQLTLLRIVDREVRSGVMVADSDMKRYFQEHRDRFALSEEYTLSQILIQASLTGRYGRREGESS